MTLGDMPKLNSELIFGALFGSNASGTISPIADHVDELHPSELEIIRNTSRKRQLEFSTGRHCAKTALAKLGIGDFPVMRNENREPLWPKGFVGSISHCRDLCGAVIAKQTDIKAIGFDIENIRELKQEIEKLTCTPQEITWLSQQTSYTYNELVILLFSLKEAIFKCISSYSNILLSFKDCSIIPELDSNKAEIHFNREDVPPDIVLHFRITKEHVYSGAYYR